MKTFPFSSVLMAFVLAGCSRQVAPPPVKPEAAPQAPLSISSAPVTEQSMPRYLQFTGELHGARQATLAPNVSGIVVSAPIERGSMLREGDVVLKLDDRAATLALQETEAVLADAKLKLQWARDEMARNQALVKTNAISALEFEHLKLNVASTDSSLAVAVARRDSAKKTLDDTVLRAPFAGTVVERLTDAGEFVGTNKGIAQLVATETLRLIIHVAETDVGHIHSGQSVTFTVPAFPGVHFTGTMKYLGAALREAARDLAVEAEVPNADGRLKPGMFAQGQVTLLEETSLTVPTMALRVDDTFHKVFVVRDGAIEERIVEVGETKGDRVEIRRGVSKGEMVVLEPGAKAVDEMKVALTAKL